MKRLLLSLTAALALGAYADTGDYGGTGFESLTPGNALNITKDDAGGDEPGFWAGEGEDFGVISNHTEAVEIKGLNGKNNYLKFEADSTLYRYAIDNAQPTRTIDVSKKAGIYFDSLVQFTGSEEIMVNNVDDRAKLAVWLYQCDTEDGAYGIGTNLIVTAGYLDAENGAMATNYVTTMNLTEGWHRLTVKMIPEIGNDTGVAGFVVFVDGVEVQNAEVKGDDGSVMKALNATAAKWAEKNALFPTMITKGEDKQTFECVGFKGQGALDELLVTENAPDFAADSTFFTLNWDAGLASLTIDEDPVEGFVEGEAGFTVITVMEAGSTYTVAAVAKDGYNLGARTVDESGNIVISGDDFVVNGTGTGNIVVNQTKFIVNGQPYSTLVEAIEAAGEGGMVKLGADIDEAISLDEANIVLDLAGHDITASTEEMADPAILVNSSATLILIDSVGGGTISGGDINNAGCVYSEGSLTIGQAEGDEGVTIDGYTYGGSPIVKGKFLADANDEDELTAAKDEDSSIDLIDDYFVVTPNGEPPVPTTYAVSWNENVPHVTAVAATVNGKPIENGDEFAAGTEVAFVVTPETGYTYDGVELGTIWSLEEDGTITATFTVEESDLTVTIPEPTEVPAPTTYTITYVDAVVTNGVTEFTAETETFQLPTAVDVEARDGGEFKGWTNELGVAVFQVEKGTEHDLTFYAVWKAAGVSYPDYIDPSDTVLKDKFDKWATDVNGGNRDVTGEAMDAFLLNCKPDEVEAAKKAFKITSIENVGGEWVVKVADAADGEEYLNGYVNIVPYDINGEAADPENAEFFQATLTVKPVDKE